MRRKDNFIKFVKVKYNVLEFFLPLILFLFLTVFAIRIVSFGIINVIDGRGGLIVTIYYTFAYFICMLGLISFVENILYIEKRTRERSDQSTYKEISADFERAVSYLDDKLRIGEKNVFVKSEGIYSINEVEYIYREIKECKKKKTNINIYFGFIDGHKIVMEGRHDRDYFMEIAEDLQRKNEKIKILEHDATHTQEKNALKTEKTLNGFVSGKELFLAIIVLLIGFLITIILRNVS